MHIKRSVARSGFHTAGFIITIINVMIIITPHKIVALF